MTERPFACTVEDGVLNVAGALDELAIITLRNAVAEHSSEHTRDLVVSLDEVDYLPSVAIGVLTRAMSRAQTSGAELTLVARPGSMAQRVLGINGLPHRPTIAAVQGDESGLLA
ncbi:STAS domain-containing protein [Nocardioides sp. SYSU D00038]|uniref:STAS domain-containing protein n=1 Tax=Nocardioides sp. SYSU D00038 TaxID=2812554 RepID=UPI001967FEBC|nr:STAS domain-containing protein [Nocardioides sp. SYSU D00038]